MGITIGFGKNVYEFNGIKGIAVEYFLTAATTGAVIGMTLGVVAGLATAVYGPIVFTSAVVDLVKHQLK